MMLGEPKAAIWFVVLIAMVLIGLWRDREASNRLSSWIPKSRWHDLIHLWTPARANMQRILWICGVMLVIFAAMRPQFGMTVERVVRKGQVIMLVMDVSKSMLARDTLPSRLERSKRELLGLVELLKGDRVGLVVFSGQAYTQCPLTLDYNALRLYIETLEVGMLPNPGSNIEMALEASSKALRANNKKFKARLFY